MTSLGSSLSWIITTVSIPRSLSVDRFSPGESTGAGRHDKQSALSLLVLGFYIIIKSNCCSSSKYWRTHSPNPSHSVKPMGYGQCTEWRRTWRGKDNAGVSFSIMDRFLSVRLNCLLQYAMTHSFLSCTWLRAPPKAWTEASVCMTKRRSKGRYARIGWVTNLCSSISNACRHCGVHLKSVVFLTY